MKHKATLELYLIPFPEAFINIRLTTSLDILVFALLLTLASSSCSQEDRQKAQLLLDMLASDQGEQTPN